VQAVRVGEQVSTRSRLRQGQAELPPPDPRVLAMLPAAVQERSRLVQAARVPIDEALAEREGHRGAQEIAELEQIQASLSRLEELVRVHESATPEAILDDVRTQKQIEALFEELRVQSSLAIDGLGVKVARAQRSTEQWTIGLAAVTLATAAFAILGVFLTLQRLRRLAIGVRRLGGGDWSQRVPLEGNTGDEVGRLATEFNHMVDALQERERRLLRSERLAAAGQLAAQITHEIRNPLSSVGLNVELLEDELPADSEGRRLLVKITKEVDRLTAITEGYLGFARRPKSDLVPMDLGAELRAMMEFLAPELDQDGVTVDVAIPGEPVAIQGDANQLRQAFLNLVRNAKEAVLDEAHRREDRPPRIGIEMRCKDGLVVVVVTDNGGGIPLPDDQVDRIFEPFYTRKARGTGLGLPMVQQIVQEHGGNVRIARTGPDGTQFEVELPACTTPGSALSSGARDVLSPSEPSA
jgi:nitrogen fixation/metabolism regulation signal transduction histidine kinase